MKKVILFLLVIMSLFSVSGAEDLIKVDEMREFQNVLDSSEYASLDAYNQFTVPKSGGIVNLLDYLDYNPGIRNQGWCGNCWVWSGTLSTELALKIEAGINEKLSVQYFNSNYQEIRNESACEGGMEWDFSQVLDIFKKIIPWTNYSDYKGDSKTPSSSMDDSVYYPVSLSYSRVDTLGLSDEEAINSIKDYLDHGKVVGFGWYFAKNEHWQTFYDFWNNNYSYDVIDMDDISLNNTGLAGGHAVNIVGYNDIERYWIVSNSWADSNGKRPVGTFRMSMDMNYQDLMVPFGMRKYDFWIYTYEFGNEAGLRIEPEVDSKVNIDKVVFDKVEVEAGDVITTSTKVSNDYEYMNLQNVRVSYYIPKLGMKRSVGPFDIEMFEDVMKRVYLDIPKGAKSGVYDVRIVLQTEDTKEVRYEEIEVK